MKVETSSEMPPGFPNKLSGPAVWSGQVADQDYVTRLTTSDLASIEAALKHFQGLGIERHLISQERFPLSTLLVAKLRDLSQAVHNGRFFGVLRGLDPNRFTEEQNVIIYGGIAQYVGKDRADMIWLYDRAKGSLSDENQAKFPPNELNNAMDFHTDVDAGDILSLYTLGLSKSGGRQHLASFWTVYNDLAQNEPEVLKVLASDWRYEMKKQQGVEVINRPVISIVDGRVQINFAAAFLKGSAYIPRLHDSPKLTIAQENAIDSLLNCCRKHCMALSQAPGDMLFVNNLAVLHARDSFTDDSQQVAGGKTRKMMSVMLRDPELAWRKPPSVAIEMGKKFAKRGTDAELFLGTTEQYEQFRDKFAMLRHD
ncbi:hypothetical protein B0I35DRAFT_409523 [Stachybotrys elegans]|uniref:TauD/TfdA-like domain-containing protein n=1 Tax=Stachybotrys elegans TaxID=80388 RepID=A0A8K0WS34_9HYPO|nr:hypothetical protein B0I35DRAFT_409523 [Stachybotrys elegans]